MTLKLINTRQTLRLVTRKSALALWQAHHVKNQLEALYSNLAIQVIGVSTEGDKNLETSLSKMGGKGLFVKELEDYLLSNKADIAVHSMKDIPAEIPKGLWIGAILERADPRDVVVMSARNKSRGITTLAQLPPGAVVGSSSLRRQAQLKAMRSDIEMRSLRGNVDTRIKKLDNNEFDAIILAAAGLERLALHHRMNVILEPKHMLPAVGQGALGIECRLEDDETRTLISPLHDTLSGWCLMAERGMNAHLGGSCQLPVAGLACIKGNEQLFLRGLVGTADGRVILRMEALGAVHEAEAIGEQVAMGLLAQGAQDIINGCNT
jgi:hydroxymethylbilane synthase